MAGGLEGRTALVTGGSGIGLACARRLATNSCNRALTHRNLTAYCVTKAGIEMLVRNAADELGAYGVRVIGEPEEIAAAVRYLGEESSWLTGQIFAVDGGHTLRRGPDLDSLIGRCFTAELHETMA